jgi:hypothetical protein
MAIHGAFTPGAHEQIMGAVDRVMFTDTINNEEATHSILEKLVAYIELNVL